MPKKGGPVLIDSLDNILKRISDFVNKITIVVTVILVGILVFIVLLQVVFRYILAIGLPWVDELSRYINVWVALLGASIVFKYNGHVGISFFTNFLSDRAFKIFKFITKIIMLLFLFAALYYSYNFIVTSRSITPGMQISYKWPKSSIFTGLGIMIVHLISFIVQDLNDFIKGKFSVQRSNFAEIEGEL